MRLKYSTFQVKNKNNIIFLCILIGYFFIDKCGFYFNLYHMVKYHEIILFELI